MVLELIDKLDVRTRLSGFEPHPWIPACVKEERDVLSGGVNLVIVLEFGEGK